MLTTGRAITDMQGRPSLLVIYMVLTHQILRTLLGLAFRHWLPDIGKGEMLQIKSIYHYEWESVTGPSD